MTTFVVRDACWSTAGTTLQIYLDSPTGTLIGTCSLPPTGGTQTWATETCNLSGATGYHNVYLVNPTGHDHNLEWFAFQGNGEGATEAASFNSETGGIGTQTCSEGGLNLDGIASGSYTVYNNMDLNGVTSFAVREAGTTSGATLQICLDSPTSTPIATCPLPTTGGAQNWATATCVLNAVSGYHTVYLVYTGPANVEWFAFKGGNGAIEGASNNSVSGTVGTETCSEGGLDLNNITAGDYVVYNNLNLNGVNAFVARVASAVATGQSAGNVAICLDSPTATPIGTLAMTGTGGAQTWSTQACPLSGATGYHNVYLVYSGSGPLPSLEWLSFQSNGGAIEASSYDSLSGTIGTEACSEGGLDLDDITNGSYTVYNQVNLTGMTSFSARVASTIPGGSIQIRLDSPTGTLIGTEAVPSTGGAQTWTTITANLTATTGYHNIYLVYVGGSGNLFSLENFQLAYDPPPALTFNAPAVIAATTDTTETTDTPLLPPWATFALVLGLIFFGVRQVRAQSRSMAR